ncbi:cell division protein FtsA [Aquisalibacillus elongatus]|uniref:Cell division protein FtsA n=1 Tax=Aquisalibacillus elongatus TaxID=485577 RepID=A0A3N5C9R0_9BACI|nr:cell division protein FtsA [Aquisalibacillus elongatus]RPF55325.1 cell division protein FtsA [Aquisalibacillus elongatus]
MSEKLFALDIGTRSVVGLILEKENERFKVLDMISQEHKERSMLDGQIHNILDVANVIRDVKVQLEQNHGPLTKVCVAAAGRALKTKRSSYSTKIYEQPLMTEEDILHLELAAVQQAQYTLAEDEKLDQSNNYYCVGYSVLHYYLDNQEIGSLLDQQGEEAKVDIIATFLPKVVVDSLISALKRADLDMEALTLEPIAAIQVLIPESMRRLNVALIDVGAGTSDIAITSEGTVTAYGMVPKAGDEISEAISEQFLLDFHQAEQVKKDLIQHNLVEFEDILGFKHEMEKDEIVKQISGSLNQLAESICHEILALNGQAPKAVMLVGGGSLTPALPEKIAEHLNLPTNRVAIRGIDAIQVLDEKEQLPDSPEFVTPIGIAIAAKQNPVQYISVEVNNRTIRLFDLKQLTLGDCLLASGIELNKLYGKPGMAIMVHLNGRKVTLPGKLGEAPTIKINGESASVSNTIKHGDVIDVAKGEDGSTPTYTVGDVVGDVSGARVQINQHNYDLPSLVNVNQQQAELTQALSDGDQIQWESQYTLKQALQACGMEHLIHKFKPFNIRYNHKEQVVLKQMVQVSRGHKTLDLTDSIEANDQLNVQVTDTLSLDDFCERMNIKRKQSVKIFYNQKPIELTKDLYKFYRNGQKMDQDSIIYPEDHIITEALDDEPFIFQDIFRHIELDLSQTRNQTFKLIKNDQEVGFVEEINDGDQLAIEWDTINTY